MVNTNSFAEQLKGAMDSKVIPGVPNIKTLLDDQNEFKAGEIVGGLVQADGLSNMDSSYNSVRGFKEAFDVNEWIASQPAVNSFLVEEFISKETEADRDTFKLLGIEGANADFYRQLKGLSECVRTLDVEQDRITFFDDMCGSLTRVSKVDKGSEGIVKKSWFRECAARMDLALERMDEKMEPRCSSSVDDSYSLFFALADDIYCAVVLRLDPLHLSVGIQTKDGEREIAILPI